MIRKCVLLFIICLLASCAGTNKIVEAANAETERFIYETVCAGVGVQGTVLLKVFSYSAVPIVAIEQSKKNAVHSIVFKGFNGSKINGCASQKSIIRSESVAPERVAYFKRFFADGGAYLKYVNLTNDGNISSGDVQRISKDRFKVGVVVSVNKASLRKKLEEDGIIIGLSSGF